MVSESVDPDGSTARLEAALERIAAAAAARQSSPAADVPTDAGSPLVPTEVVARLDRLIERLRGALTGPGN
jgi:hypothetical protein